MNVSAKGSPDFAVGKHVHKKESKSKDKKHKKKKSKKKKKKAAKSDSDDDSSSNSEGQWTEKTSDPQEPSFKTAPEAEEKPNAEVRDEWMSLPGLFPSVTKERKQPKKPNDDQKLNLDAMGQSKYELNPYWKSGGTGLPESHKEAPVAVGTVGDLGADWLRRALTRAKEQAKEEGRSLEEVAAERWGSLAKLETMLAEAEAKSANKSKYNQSEREDRYKYDNRDRRNDRKTERREDSRHERHRERRDEEGRTSDRSRMFQKPNDDESRTSDRSRMFLKPNDDESRTSDRSRMFQKPRRDDDDEPRHRDSHRSSSSHGRDGGWRKREYKCDREEATSRKSDDPQSSHDKRSEAREDERGLKKPIQDSVSTKMDEDSKRGNVRLSEFARRQTSDDEDDEVKVEKEQPKSPAALTDKEMNDLGAKLVKAEILGNETLAAELKQKLDAARAVRSLAPSRPAVEIETEVVVLTRTDARGFTRPVAAAAEAYGGRQKKRKVETHDRDGQRVRYFPDDDHISLKEMFESEKMNSVEDSNKMFSDMASKVKPSDDMADIFEDRACREESAGKREARDRSLAIGESRRNERALDSCNMCFDSKRMLKHLVIAIGTKAYLSLPPQQSLTDGHCFIIPLNHAPCSTQLDEDVWAEIQSYRRALTAMFVSMDQDVVFVETAMHLRKFPHMWLECIPMPTETGHLAPIYFKKAILECEMEWSTNKKLVDTSSKDVRRSIPKGLPYFSVDFGNEGGFAHVIEDEAAFPKNFAQEIVGGMLDLDHRLWRKPQKESFDAQRKKVLEFAKWWKPHDISRGDKSDSDSS